MIKTIIAAFRFFFYLIVRQGIQRKLFRLQAAGNFAERDRILAPMIRDWCQFVVRLTGKKTTVTVSGQENLPERGAVLFIANHQSYLDIPVLLGYVPKQMGFIAKSDLLKVPFLSGWMKLLECVFLDRKNIRQSIKDMELAGEKIRRGYSLLIFPEGHRSKSDSHGTFKAGSFKLAFKTGVPIVPVTVNGTWKLFEGSGRLRAADVFVTIHPPVSTENLTKEDQHRIVGEVERTVFSALPPAPGKPHSEGSAGQ